MTVSYLTMLVVLGNTDKYPDAVLEMAVGAGDMESVLSLCYQHLDQLRRTYAIHHNNRDASDMRTFLARLSDESPKFGRVVELHESGVCTQCTINKQGRLPRWSR